MKCVQVNNSVPWISAAYLFFKYIYLECKNAALTSPW